MEEDVYYQKQMQNRMNATPPRYPTYGIIYGNDDEYFTFSDEDDGGRIHRDAFDVRIREMQPSFAQMKHSQSSRSWKVKDKVDRRHSVPTNRRSNSIGAIPTYYSSREFMEDFVEERGASSTSNRRGSFQGNGAVPLYDSGREGIESIMEHHLSSPLSSRRGSFRGAGTLPLHDSSRENLNIPSPSRSPSRYGSFTIAGAATLHDSVRESMNDPEERVLGSPSPSRRGSYRGSETVPLYNADRDSMKNAGERVVISPTPSRPGSLLGIYDDELVSINREVEPSPRNIGKSRRGIRDESNFISRSSRSRVSNYQPSSSSDDDFSNTTDPLEVHPIELLNRVLDVGSIFLKSAIQAAYGSDSDIEFDSKNKSRT